MTKKEKIRDLFHLYVRYGIISFLVFVSLVILPMISTDLNVGWEFPHTTLGWISYIVIRCLVGVITFLIFVSFDQQGKVNILQDERYIAAYNKMCATKDKHYIPISPQQYKLQTYGFKATSIAVTSIITAFVVVSCILSYNYMILLAYGLSIIFSVIFGIIQMLKAEIWWVEEFPQWVDYHVEQLEKENKLEEKKEIIENDN